MAVISPIPPTSASNLQPSTPNDSMDKTNTPAATPTGDHQDSKSTTASPYVMPAPPSVEAPPTALLEQLKVRSEPATSGCSSGNSSGNSSSSSSSSNTSIAANTCGIGGSSTSGNNSTNTNSTTASASNVDNKNYLALMKRPALQSRDYENIVDDDSMPQRLLYDYSTWDAWLVYIYIFKCPIIFYQTFY